MRQRLVRSLLCLAAALSAAAAEPRGTAGLRLVIPFYGPEEMALADKYLRPGDIVVFFPPAPELKASGLPQEPEFWIQKVREFKARHPKPETLFNFDGIKELREWTPRLPPEVDWVSYDYEKWEWTPEYNSDQEHSLRYFEEARRIVHRHHKRLFLTPIPFFSPYFIDFALKVRYLPEKAPAWDLGAVAGTGDALNAQFQYFLKDLAWLEPAVREMSSELKKKASKTTFYVQAGEGMPRQPYTDEELRKALEAIAAGGAQGVVVWFGPKRSEWGARVLEMIRGEPQVEKSR